MCCHLPRTVDVKSLLPGIAETFYNVIINLHLAVISYVFTHTLRTVGRPAAYIFANIKFLDLDKKFHDFQCLESKLTNSMTFEVFQDQYEPCILMQLLIMVYYAMLAIQCSHRAPCVVVVI